MAKKIIIWVLIVLLLLGGGGTLYYLFSIGAIGFELPVTTEPAKADLIALYTEPPTEPTKPDDPWLPQTGQMNGLVPLMAAGGLLLVLLGVLMCSRRRKDRG